MSHRRTTRLWLLALVAVTVLPAAQDWSNYDWSAEELDLSVPGENTATAMQAAQQAAAASPMRLNLSAVGFDIRPGSTAETYLQKVASVGGGSYFRAEAGGQLGAALGQAATGQSSTPTGPTVGQLIVCRRLDEGEPQGAADQFPRLPEVWVKAEFTDLPENTTVVCVWTREGKEVMRSQRTAGGQSGWVAFAIKTTDPKGFPAGTYVVKLTAGNTVLGQKQFKLGP